MDTKSCDTNKKGQSRHRVMEKIYSRQVSITVKNLLQANQLAESSTWIMNKFNEINKINNEKKKKKWINKINE